MQVAEIGSGGVGGQRRRHGREGVGLRRRVGEEHLGWLGKDLREKGRAGQAGHRPKGAGPVGSGSQ